MFDIRELEQKVVKKSKKIGVPLLPAFLILCVILTLLYIRRTTLICENGFALQTQGDITHISCKDPDFFISCKSLTLQRRNGVWFCSGPGVSKYTIRIQKSSTLVNTEK